jgi:hypothetical protein
LDIELTQRPRRTTPRLEARTRRRIGKLVCCVATLAAAPWARAQTASPEDIASARVLGTEGVRLAESGDCSSAVPKLEAAERLYHAPTTLERLGECQVSLGRLVAGTESLNRVVRETLPPGAPQAFMVAQQRAQQVLATALPRIGKLRIHVEGAPIDKVTVTVDGATVPSALFDADRATDPGAHEVRAAAPGYKPTALSVQVAPGVESPVSLKLEPDANAVAGALDSSTSPLQPGAQGGSPGAAVFSASTPASPASGSPNRAPAYVAFGVGVVGVAVGSVFGVMALGTKSTLDSACNSGKTSCPSASQSDIDALSSRALISNIGFAVGIVGVAVGTVLLITSHGSEGATASAASPAQRRGRRSPWIGVGAAGLGGTFE